MANQGFGRSVKRVEDQRFLTGKGRYTDDINRFGQVYGIFVRSTRAHAKINAIDTTEAERAPGVLKVLTGEDVTADKLGGIPCGFVPGNGPQNMPERPALARGKVRYVGDMVAFVVARTREEARDAAEKVDVDYEPLDAVVDPAQAQNSESALLHEDAPNNLCVSWDIGNKAETEQAFTIAKHIVEVDLRNNRKAPNAMEPRACVGEYDTGTESFTLHTTSQNPHITRLLLSAYVLGVPEHKVRIVSPDVGGGFGSKIPFYPEEAVVAWAARKVGRPVKWTASRSEAFMSDTHGRDHVTHAELALDADAKFLGIRVNTTANLGAYLSTFGALSATYLYACLLSGQYRVPGIHCQVTGVFTNTAPIDAERGAGRPEATFVTERLVEMAARQLGMDPVEIRRRNFIQKDEFPYETPVALTYDLGDYNATLDEALKLVDYDSFGERRRASERRGKLRGIGFSNYIEACGLAPSNVAGAIGAGIGLYETAEVRFSPTGTVSVFTGSQTQGQGHETAFAQIVSDRLGIPVEQVRVVHGDTGEVQWGHGTYGSRSLAVGGSAIAEACGKVVEKARKVAAHLMEASVSDIEFENGQFTVAGTDKSKSIGDVIMASYVPHNFPLDEMEPGLDERSYYDPKNFTYPAGCHISEVEIDPETGETRIVDWVAVDDFGTLLNPMIVEGQVHGGIAHGVGQAMLEEVLYDEDGQLVTGSYQDYTMPRADDLPAFRVGYTETPCPHNPLGAKGCGEAGAIAAPAAFINAVTDALGTEDISMPATREKIWRAAQARPAMAAE